jgi:tetratricopeptide (TPR) repeat protein
MDGDDQEQAVEELGSAHASFSLVEDRHGVARTCVNLASIMLDREDPQVARNYLEEALDNIEMAEDLTLLSWVHYYLGEADRMEEMWESATDHYEQAVELFLRSGEEQMAANSCTYLGDAYQAIGDSERAEIFYQRGLDMMVAQ